MTNANLSGASGKEDNPTAVPPAPITKDQAVRSLNLLRLVVSEIINLSPDDYGCCPFHSEATPSFHIFKAKSGRARYHCFGCGAAGDVFNFLQRTKQLNFASSLEFISVLIGRPVNSAFYSLPEAPESRTPNTPNYSLLRGLLDSTDNPPTKFCEKDCPKYAALREDYNFLLESRISAPLPDLSTIPELINTILRLQARIKILEEKLNPPASPLFGFGRQFGAPKP